MDAIEISYLSDLEIRDCDLVLRTAEENNKHHDPQSNALICVRALEVQSHETLALYICHQTLLYVQPG
jgi:hypothetical protein